MTSIRHHHQKILQISHIFLLLISVSLATKDGSEGSSWNQKDYESRVQQHFVHSSSPDNDDSLSSILQPQEVNYSGKQVDNSQPMTFSTINDDNKSGKPLPEDLMSTISQEITTSTTPSSEESEESSEEYEDETPSPRILLGSNVKFTLSVEDERYLRTSNENGKTNPLHQKVTSFVTVVTSDSMVNKSQVGDTSQVVETSTQITALENVNNTFHKSPNDTDGTIPLYNVTTPKANVTTINSAINSTLNSAINSTLNSPITTHLNTFPSTTQSSTSTKLTKTTPTTITTTLPTTTLISTISTTNLPSTTTSIPTTKATSPPITTPTTSSTTPKEIFPTFPSTSSISDNNFPLSLSSSPNLDSNTFINLPSAHTEPSVYRPTIRSRHARPKMISNLKTRHSTTQTTPPGDIYTTTTLFTTQKATLKETMAPPVMTLLKDATLDYQMDENPLDVSVLFNQEESSEATSSTISATTTNTIVISSVIGGCAILFFAVIMIFYMWKQRTVRRRRKRHPEVGSGKSPFNWNLGDIYSNDYE